MNSKVPSRSTARKSSRPIVVAGLFVAACSTELPDGDVDLSAVTVDWGECPEGQLPSDYFDDPDGELRSEAFSCGTLSVPLDYDEPDGEQIDIAIGRLSAGVPDERLGAIFVNPGGPGGSGVRLAATFEGRFPGPMPDHYDIIGFDPRGIWLSTTFTCFESGVDRSAVSNFDFVPGRGTDSAAFRENDESFAEACAREGGPLIDHMSTANVARDMERLRIALDEEQIDFFGGSYGTLLGATYANLFSDRVRLMALDGAVDPVEWFGDSSTSLEPLFARTDRAASQQATLDEFFRLCDETPDECAFAPSSKERFEALLERASSPDGLMFPNGSTTAYGEPGPLGPYDFLHRVETATLFTAGWKRLADELADAERGDLSYDPSYEPDDADFDTSFEFGEGLLAVLCGETDGPADWNDIAGHAADEQAQLGAFGALYAWSISECAVWPGQDDDRYTGPWGAVTEHPILITNSTFDPATPIDDARALNDLLGNSVLVEAEAWGHISWFHNECALDVIEDYFATMTVPEDGMVCPGDGNPFLQDDPVEGEDENEDEGDDEDTAFLTDEEYECLVERGVAEDEFIDDDDFRACVD